MVYNKSTVLTYFSDRDDFQVNFKESNYGIEDLKSMIANSNKITIEKLNSLNSDIAKYLDKLKKRLDNEYAQSIQIFYNELNLDQIILVGYDDRINQLSNYAVFQGKDIYCRCGNTIYDGHLNEFINNVDGFVPNSKYHLENATYLTNDKGFVCDTYERHSADRNTDRNYRYGSLKAISDAKGGCDSDVGGHIIAHCIDGATESINILPMDSKFNNSECWKSMETKLLEAYQNNKNIIVHRHIDYAGDQQRPSKIFIEAQINSSYMKWEFNLP